MNINVIVTGTTGMVGEGVLLECLAHPDVKQVLSVVRKPSGLKHPKLKELAISDFMKPEGFRNQLAGYDACFYCAGITSIGASEADYTRITYDTTIKFARVLNEVNKNMVFCYISGAMTDSTEKGRLMWARVKGRTENELMRIFFKRAYNFRPGFIQPAEGQQKLKPFYKVIGVFYPVIRFLFPRSFITMQELGQAMINSVLMGYEKQVLEIQDIKKLQRMSQPG